MKTQANKSPYLPLLIVGIAVILFSTAGIAAIMRWFPALTGGSVDILAFDMLPVASAKPVEVTAQAAPGQADGRARARPKCPGCGVIVSMRKIEMHDEDSGPGAAGGETAGSPDETQVQSTNGYEIIIRMADQTRRVINHASPASWRPGERVILIDDATSSSR